MMTSIRENDASLIYSASQKAVNVSFMINIVHLLLI